MCQRGDFDKFPKWFTYSMYPMFIQSGMVSGIGIATYTPIMTASFLYYWRDAYNGYLEGQGLKL